MKKTELMEMSDFAYRNRIKIPTTIIIHHTGGMSLSGALSQLKKDGNSYHRIIDEAGIVSQLVPYDKCAYHAGIHNEESIGIALVGDFSYVDPKTLVRRQPTFKQIESLRTVINTIVMNYKIEKIIGHNEVSNTLCPAFDITALKDLVNVSAEHWAESSFKNLNEKGIKIHERRFDSLITRGEIFSLLSQIIK